MHNAVTDGLGKIGVMVALESSGKADELAASAGRSRCMSPRPIRWRSMLPGSIRRLCEREKDVLADKFKQQGKPANVIEKIVESGLKTFYKEVCLLEQPFIFDDKKSVAQALKEAEGKVGRSDQGRRFCALCARRGHREAGNRFRRRGRGRRGSELIATASAASASRRSNGRIATS